MATQLQIRRGTTSQMNAFTGAEGELAVNTTTDTVHVHDGSTAGGFALAKADGSNIGTYAGSFTTLAASGATTLSSTLAVTGQTIISSDALVSTPSTYYDDIVVQNSASGTGAGMTVLVNATNGFGGVKFGDSTNSNQFGIGFDANANSGFLDVSGAQALTVTSNRSVGIGSILPDSLLHVSGVANLRIAYNGTSANYMDADTNIFRSGNGLERMRIDGATGSVGIGASNPSAGAVGGKVLHVQNSGATASVRVDRSDASTSGTLSITSGNGSNSLFSTGAKSLNFSTNSTTRMTLDATGRVGIGTSNPDTTLHLQTPSGTKSEINFAQTAVTNYRIGVPASTDALVFTYGASTERLRIDSSGRLLVNTTSILDGTSAKLQVLQTVGGHWSTRINNSTTLPFGLAISYTGAAPNNGSSQFIYCADTTAGRFQVTSNGNVGSATSSYGGMSDLKLKENIVDASSQWDDLKAVRVRNYSFKEENSSEPTQIGVIAQEVEAAGMAGLVYETADQGIVEDGSFVDTGEVTKNMKYSILYMKAVKALQEAMTRIETLEAKVQTLENT